jgi:hypothetical protein
MIIVSSVVIRDFDIRRAASPAWPFEADAPLLVNANAELPGPVGLQRFEPIATERSQFVQTYRRVENFQPTVSLARKTLKIANETAFRERQGSFVPIAQDHDKT